MHIVSLLYSEEMYKILHVCSGVLDVAACAGHEQIAGRVKNGRTYCSSVKPVKFLQYPGKSSNW